MKLIQLQIEPTILYPFIYIVVPIVGLVIFYYLIKAAVKNGIIEAKESLNNLTVNSASHFPNTAQIELQKRFDDGEITLEEYQAKWNELN